MLKIAYLKLNNHKFGNQKNKLVYINNLYICLNKNTICAFKKAYLKDKIYLYRNTKYGQIILKIKDTNVLVKVKSKVKVDAKIIYVTFNNSANYGLTIKSSLDKINLNINKYCYPFLDNFKATTVVNFSTMQNTEIGFILRFSEYLNITGKVYKEKQNKSIFNTNQICKLGNRFVFNTNIKNIFNLHFGKKYLKDIIKKFNKYISVLTKDRVVFIFPDGFFDFSLINKFKVNLKNKYLQYLINDYLPSRVISQYLNNFYFVPFSKVINQTKLVDMFNKFNYKAVLKYLIKHKMYIECYNYVLVNLLGVNIFNNNVVFSCPKFNVGNIYVNFNNNQFLICSNNFKTMVVYKGIVYNNPTSLCFEKYIDTEIDKVF